MDEDCIFCKIAKREIPATIIYEDEEIIAFEDINSKAPVHFLFIPRKHIGTLNDVGTEDAALLGRLLTGVRRVAKEKAIAEGGYRVVINCNKDAGQEVLHLHVHLLGGRSFSWPPG